MPNELEFMKSRDEKGMPEEEYKAVRGEYGRKADALGTLLKKIIFAVLGLLTVSFIAINIAGFAVESLPEFSFVWLVAFIIIIALLLYDPKVEEDKRYKYETDQKIILKSLKDKIKANKTRLGAVIALSVISIAANIGCWWFIIDVMRQLQ